MEHCTRYEIKFNPSCAVSLQQVLKDVLELAVEKVVHQPFARGFEILVPKDSLEHTESHGSTNHSDEQGSHGSSNHNEEEDYDYKHGEENKEEDHDHGNEA